MLGNKTSKSEYPPLIEIEPQLVTDLKMLLAQTGEAMLGGQVEELLVVERYDNNYGSDFYMVSRPEEHWDPGHRTLSLRPGALHIDVVNGQIVCVEVLRKLSQATLIPVPA